ncbi:MAG: hypothetical protein HYZ27_10225 [Deltaproteobacteria bacterium]|nr:hypothetical protein [Deltaproteobacteria bacterium]
MNDSTKFAIRAPTGSAWLLTVVGVIAAGELLFERSKAGMAHLFNIPFADNELLLLAAPFALAALWGAGWLALLYARPGWFCVEPGSLSRERPRAWRRQSVQGPPENWQVRVVYFSETERAAGRFKRLELRTQGLREVILFGDLKDGPALAQALEAQRQQLGKLEVVVEL